MGFKARPASVPLVVATWSEIATWFTVNDARCNLESLRSGASCDQLDELERAVGVALPADLRTSLATHDGGGDFESYEYLGVAEIAARHSDLRQWSLAPKLWKPEWIPFAEDSCGNLICSDSGAGGTLVYVELQGPQGAFPASTTVADWLRQYCDKLVAGELVVDEEGFVAEPITPPAVTPTETLEHLPTELSKKLDTAIKAGELSAVLALIDQHGVDVDRQVHFYDLPLLTIAAENKQTAIVRALLERGVDVDVGRAQGLRTPLFWALWGSRIDIDLVRFLLDRGADPNAMTAYDGTPMHSAAMWSHREAWDLLIAAGGDASATDAKGRTARESMES